MMQNLSYVYAQPVNKILFIATDHNLGYDITTSNVQQKSKRDQVFTG